MKKLNFTEIQIVAAIRKQESGIAVKEICREPGYPPPSTTGKPVMAAWKYLSERSLKRYKHN